MPNWVENEVTIKGSAEEIAKLKEQVGKSYIQKWLKKKFNTESQAWEIAELEEGERKEVFSFWNIIKPADTILEAYYGIVDDKPDATGLTVAEKIQAEMAISNHWYDWNVRNWGTKWEACDVSLVEEEETELVYFFSTAWSPAEPVLEELAQQYPSLFIELIYEEEGGWGGTALWAGGDLVGETFYEEPKSHSEVEEARGKECFCDGTEEGKVFSDCPVLVEA